MPSSRNTRIRPKNTSRAEARRRHRDEQREAEVEPIEFEEADNAAAATQKAKRPGFALPNVFDDIKALPQVFRKPLVWLPFGLLLLTFVLAVALINGLLDEMEGPVMDGITLYVSLTLHPTTLFIFFIGGFLAPRASYLVGGMLGVLSGTLFVAVIAISSKAAPTKGLDAIKTIIAPTDGAVPAVSADLALQTIGMGLVIGVVAGGFASWYRRFLRSSQERAKLNRMAKEQDQAKKAKEQARVDKQAARDARRKV